MDIVKSIFKTIFFIFGIKTFEDNEIHVLPKVSPKEKVEQTILKI